MSGTSVITARVNPDVATLLDQLASELDRSRAWIISTAVERYVREELEFIAFIKEGEEDLDAGRVTTHEEVMTRFKVERANRSAA